MLKLVSGACYSFASAVVGALIVVAFAATTPTVAQDRPVPSEERRFIDSRAVALGHLDAKRHDEAVQAFEALEAFVREHDTLARHLPRTLSELIQAAVGASAKATGLAAIERLVTAQPALANDERVRRWRQELEAIPDSKPPAPPPPPPPPPPAGPTPEEIATRAAEAAARSTEIRLRMESARRAGQRRESARDALADLDAVLRLEPNHADAKKLRAEIVERWRPRRGDTTSVPLNPNVDIDMVFIEPGWFWMGSHQSPEQVVAAYPSGNRETDQREQEWFANEHPRHRVRISRGFWLGRTEVSVDQFAAFVQASGHRTTAEREGKSHVWRDGRWQEVNGIHWRNPGMEQTGSHPVIHVSWNDAVIFCDWLTERHRREGRIGSSQRYRLPTEAEWEYACRAGTTTAFSFGDRLEQGRGHLNGAGQGEGWTNEAYLWPFNDGWSQRTAPVGTFQANPWGLHDMHGNVYEWCADRYDAQWYQPGKWPTNAASERLDPTGPTTGGLRVVRGGSWINYPGSVRSACRSFAALPYRSVSVGFRLALDSE